MVEMLYVTHVSAMPRLLPERRIAAEVFPDCPDVPGKRSRPPEDHRQPRAPRRTDRFRHPRKAFRCPFPVRGEEGAVVQGRGSDGNLGAVVWPRADLYFLVEEAGLAGSDRFRHEAENRHLRSRSGDLPDGVGASARSFEQTLHAPVGGDDLVGRRRRRGTAALLPVAGNPGTEHQEDRRASVLPGAGPVHPGAGSAVLRHHVDLLHRRRADDGVGVSRFLQGQPPGEQAGDGGRGDDAGRNPAGSPRLPREHAGCGGLLGSDRGALDPVRDQARDRGGRPRDVQCECDRAHRGTQTGVHRRREDAAGLGRERDRAGEQSSLRDGHREPVGEVGRVGGRAVHRLSERGRGQTGPGRPGGDRVRSSGEDREGSQEDDRQHRVPSIPVRRQGRRADRREEDRLGEKVRRDLRPADQHRPVGKGGGVGLQGVVESGAGVPGDQEHLRDPAGVSAPRGSDQGPHRRLLPGVLSSGCVPSGRSRGGEAERAVGPLHAAGSLRDPDGSS